VRTLPASPVTPIGPAVAALEEKEQIQVFRQRYSPQPCSPGPLRTQWKQPRPWEGATRGTSCPRFWSRPTTSGGGPPYGSGAFLHRPRGPASPWTGSHGGGSPQPQGGGPPAAGIPLPAQAFNPL